MKKLLILALSLAVAAPGLGVAADRADATAVKVSYGDLDLSAAQGAATLLKRVDRAALAACGASEFSFRAYREAVRRSDCFDQAMSRAVASIDLPTLTAHYKSATVQNFN